MAELPIRTESVDVLLFDLGGVVIDIDFGRCMARWATRAGLDPEDVAARFSFDAAYEEHERGTLDAAGYFESLRQLLSVDVADRELLEGWNDIYLGEVNFWRDYLSGGNPKVVMNFGDQSAVIFRRFAISSLLSSMMVRPTIRRRSLLRWPPRRHLK